MQMTPILWKIDVNVVLTTCRKLGKTHKNSMSALASDSRSRLKVKYLVLGNLFRVTGHGQ